MRINHERNWAGVERNLDDLFLTDLNILKDPSLFSQRKKAKSPVVHQIEIASVSCSMKKSFTSANSIEGVTQ
ncbi:hypothetical protein CW749_23115 [Vibrio sp. vnigr-6D03]|nr:hypothetical protein CW749_23115 [Vibrio sp. vnigr-6D03]